MLCCVVVRYRVPRDSTLTALGHYVGYCPFSALFSALSPSMLSACVSALCIACLFAWMVHLGRIRMDAYKVPLRDLGRRVTAT
jgi:hypothetical protein